MSSYTGVVVSVGGPELGATGNEKPRKIVLSPREGQTKTFRVWSNSDVFQTIEQIGVGKQITVEFTTEQRQGPSGPYTQNSIVGVQNGLGGGNQEATAGGEVSGSADWSVPSESTNGALYVSTPVESVEEVLQPQTKDDYWQRREQTDKERSLEMEAAWAVKTTLDRVPLDEGIDDDTLIQRAIQIALLKRAVASELGK